MPDTPEQRARTTTMQAAVIKENPPPAHECAVHELMPGAAGEPLPEGDQVRANTYGLLGALLASAPTAEVLGLLRSIGSADAAADPGRLAGADGFAAAWQTLRLAAERADPGSLDDEYHDLFIGVGRGEVMPYGSWYMTGFTMDRPLVYLRRDLAALGFERQDHVKEPEDHAAALCETMGLVIAGGEISVEHQRRFFGDHMAPWMKTFFTDLQGAKAARFYRAVGQFGEEFLDFEARYLNMTV